MRLFSSPSCLCMYTQDVQDYVTMCYIYLVRQGKKRGSVVGKVLEGEGTRLRKGP